MPDFEARIAAWRRALAGHLRGRPGRGDVLDELEDHLRDELDRLTLAGVAPEQAWQEATARLGRPDEIGAEFGKVAATAPWLPVRVAWVAGSGLAACVVWPLLPRVTAGGPAALLAAHTAAVTLGYVTTLAVGFLAVCFLLTRLFRDLPAGQARSLRRASVALSGVAAALVGAGVGLAVWCPHEKAGWCCGLDTHEVAGLAILAWDAVLLLACLLCRQAGKLAAVMLLGVVGNALVILGWYLAGSAHLDRAAPVGVALVAVLLLSHLAVACTAFAPAGCLRGGRT